MRHINNHDSTHRSASKASDVGVLAGTLGLVAGTAWGLKHTRPRRSSSTEPQQSGDAPWLLGIAAAGLAGMALGASRRKTTRFDARGHDDVTLSSHVIIRRPVAEVYRYWKDFRNLPRVMSFIERVEPQEGNISHWVARLPTGRTVEWDAETVEEQPGKQLAWHSLEGSELHTWGTVTFTPDRDGKGTELAVVFNFSPPENATGATARFLSGLESAALEHDLYQLKSRMEAAVIPQGG